MKAASSLERAVLVSRPGHLANCARMPRGSMATVCNLGAFATAAMTDTTTAVFTCAGRVTRRETLLAARYSNHSGLEQFRELIFCCRT
jgi:hypothetical protein